jgi:prepilin-type N-terminal cleavage/methylation domain-containing protein
MMRAEEKGFTLIELVLVLLILSIIAGVALSSVRGIMAETTLGEATQEVINALRYARNLAMQENTTRLVDFNPAQNTCSLLLGYQSSGNNLLTFDNTLNPPGSDNWGVRNVKVTNGKTVLFNDPAPHGWGIGDNLYQDKMDYNFAGSGQSLKLAYSVYDSDFVGEVAIYFNGVKVADAIKGGNNGWTGTKTIDLPSVVIGDVSIINPIDKKPFVIDFKTSPRLAGVDIVSSVFGGLDDVLFNPDGTPSQGGSIVLSCKGRTKTIVVDSGTGNISIQ